MLLPLGLSLMTIATSSVVGLDAAARIAINAALTILTTGRAGCLRKSVFKKFSGTLRTTTIKMQVDDCRNLHYMLVVAVMFKLGGG